MGEKIKACMLYIYSWLKKHTQQTSTRPVSRLFLMMISFIFFLPPGGLYGISSCLGWDGQKCRCIEHHIANCPHARTRGRTDLNPVNQLGGGWLVLYYNNYSYTTYWILIYDTIEKFHTFNTEKWQHSSTIQYIEIRNGKNGEKKKREKEDITERGRASSTSTFDELEVVRILRVWLLYTRVPYKKYGICGHDNTTL